MSWISVRNWSRLQHYEDRNPPWIKLYVRQNRDCNGILDDQDLNAMSAETRWIYVALLALAAHESNAIPNVPAVIALQANVSTRRVRAALRELSTAGFISVSASKPASNRASTTDSDTASASRAPAQSRRARERDRPPKSPTSKNGRGDGGDLSKITVHYEHVCPECGVELKTAGRLAEHRWVSHDVPLSEEAER